MYNNVRDYIVSSERIGSLLKDNRHDYKKVRGQDKPQEYLIRIRTKWPREAICANTTVMQFHEMGIALKAAQKHWGEFAKPKRLHKWPAYSSIKLLTSPESKISESDRTLINFIISLQV